MVYHPIIALHAHVGGYIFRKTFVGFTADKIGKKFSFCFSEFACAPGWKSYLQKNNLRDSFMINMADPVFQ